jgi:hypothetical protein
VYKSVLNITARHNTAATLIVKERLYFSNKHKYDIYEKC